ncbi:MAG: hypothetical protein P1Q69_03430 [Candidatus Thorarchaeota archaeon]|nr:hypothetical protein [Candidatus Thorarchaeota archaeon]
MSPRKELTLFASQMGMMIGFIFTILSIIPMGINYGTENIAFWLGAGLFSFSIVLATVSVAKMIGIIRKLKVGFSVILFLSTNWFFIRSPNRNSFFLITMFAVGSVISGALSIILIYAGEIALYSIPWFSLISGSIGSAVLTFVLSVRAKRKADRLEELNNE